MLFNICIIFSKFAEDINKSAQNILLKMSYESLNKKMHNKAHYLIFNVVINGMMKSSLIQKVMKRLETQD